MSRAANVCCLRVLLVNAMTEFCWRWFIYCVINIMFAAADVCSGVSDLAAGPRRHRQGKRLDMRNIIPVVYAAYAIQVIGAYPSSIHER